MARRKKEPQSVHRKAIAFVAQDLFLQKGIERTSMDDIAKSSGYSKATLYVYFKSKEILVSYLVLQSMQTLYNFISKALQDNENCKDRFFGICNSLYEYHKLYPLYFSLVHKTIRFDEKCDNFLPEEKETFEVGEKINAMVYGFIDSGIKNGDFSSDLKIKPTIFTIWGMVSGLIELASNKEEYLKTIIEVDKNDFLQKGFALIFDSIKAR
ncbi:MAG: TetR/AcrR family transcriptional regulator [Succinivibrio sp.]|nr:TetR/AcrR family transcriptional regulator [Succinatimonas sp.]MCI7026039.1 TetR/AcrR family transcriptional regulator [Succinatimonas sp.]MDY6245637.1 TetR/AcrR family transcriptional regulator [Succinivibrio sp.]